MEIVDIRRTTDWLRETFKEAGKVIAANVDTFVRMRSIKSELYWFNLIDGADRGVFVHMHYCSKRQLAVFVCVTIEQRQYELDNPKYRYEWKKQIPPDCR